MNVPRAHLAMAAAAHAHLLERLDTLTDEVAAAPSLLPGWSRAELITHIARNADSHRRMCEGAMQGIVERQYADLDQRSAEIAAGMDRPAAELVADLARSIEWLHETWDAMTDEGWDGALGFMSGEVPARLGPWRRTFEVEVHHADLDVGYTHEAWPESFVEEGVQMVVLGLPGRVLVAPAEMDDGMWVLWADDLELAWVVDVAPEGVAVLPLGDDQPDGMVRGSAAALLWWLLGRDPTQPPAGLSVVGDVPDLPRLFPYR